MGVSPFIYHLLANIVSPILTPCGYIEYNCAIICACGVTYKLFLQRNFGFLWKNRSSSVRTTRFSRSVTSNKLTAPRSKSLKQCD